MAKKRRILGRGILYYVLGDTTMVGIGGKTNGKKTRVLRSSVKKLNVIAKDKRIRGKRGTLVFELDE